MEPESNNQIDRLLRRHGRIGEATPAVGSGNGLAFVHLDADELNAFASNAVPPAARIRYVNHLAECTDCRRLATQLAVAANPTLSPGAAAATAAPASTVWKRITSWIKPPTLRYAGPVLAVLCVAVIMGVVLRTQYGSRMLNEQAEVRAPAENNANVVARSTPADSESGGSGTPADTGSGAPAPIGSSEADKQQLPGTPGAPQGTPVPETTVTSSKIGPVGEKELASEAPIIAKAPPVLAPPPPAPAAQPAKDADEPAAKSKVDSMEERSTVAGKAGEPADTGARSERKIEMQKQEGSTSAGSGGVVAGGDRRQNTNLADSKKNSAPPAKGGPNRSRNTDQLANQTADREQTRMDSNVQRDGANDDSRGRTAPRAANEPSTSTPATRSVSGRQFRRQGNMWVDTGYVTGYGTTNVKRGSEQYRALVADEPGLRTVAEQLSGEVIVVWKGRAYRFK